MISINSLYGSSPETRVSIKKKLLLKMLNLEEEDARKTEGTKTPCVPRIKCFQAKTININPALRRIFLRQACNQLMVGRITSCSCHVVVVVYKSNLKLVSVLENGLCQHQVLFV